MCAYMNLHASCSCSCLSRLEGFRSSGTKTFSLLMWVLGYMLLTTKPLYIWTCYPCIFCCFFFPVHVLFFCWLFCLGVGFVAVLLLLVSITAVLISHGIACLPSSPYCIILLVSYHLLPLVSLSDCE